MKDEVKIKEIYCKTAIGKCGFPGGGFSINPYVGCAHNCQYCYARFMKRFTGHNEDWGYFVDARKNMAEILAKEIQSPKFKNEQIYIGTVTDPYQPVEKKYVLTRKILEVLSQYENSVSILTKSDLILRDLDLLKKIKVVNVNFTINTFDEKWKNYIEPGSPSIEARLCAASALAKEGIDVYMMMGPYWPYFTEPEAMFKKFKEIGVTGMFAESLNTTGDNWSGIENVLKNNYPELLPKMKEIFFEPDKFYEFYSDAEKKIKELSKRYNIPANIYFGLGHAAKFKNGK